MQKVIGKVRAAVEKYNMIEDGDRIAVGVSGGKDSLFLFPPFLYFLSPKISLNETNNKLVTKKIRFDVSSLDSLDIAAMRRIIATAK